MSDDAAVRAWLRQAGVRAHPIWIAPTWLEELVSEERLDGVQWVERAATAGVGSLLLVAKQHDGRCIGPTRQPALTTADDLLGAICHAADPAGIGVFAYYSRAIDDDQVQRHPDCAVVSPDAG